MKTIFSAQARYRVAKGFIVFFMLFSAYYTYTHPEDFQRLGFPDYFRIQLSTWKVIGVIVLVLPKIPIRMREWVYVAFAICMLSALVAHLASADPISRILFVSLDAVIFTTAAVTVQRYEERRMNDVTVSHKLTN